MLRGRTFTPHEMRHGNAAIVDQRFVERHRLQEPVIGTQLRVEETVSARPDARSINGTSPAIVPVTIVGVVSRPMARPMAREPEASLYLPLRAVPDYVSAYLRSSSGAGIISHARQTMAAIDPELPPIRIATLATRFDEEAGDIRLVAQAASGLGVAALLLAVAGVYSVIAFFVSLRTHEFGIRVAIGARPRDILNMVLLQASRLVGLGLIAGSVLAVPVLIGLGKVFPSAPALDAIGLFLPSVALALTALAAAGLPARRAARTEPVSALRAE
jgi:hypothetical protein